MAATLDCRYPSFCEAYLSSSDYTTDSLFPPPLDFRRQSRRRSAAAFRQNIQDSYNPQQHYHSGSKNKMSGFIGGLKKRLSSASSSHKPQPQPTRQSSVHSNHYMDLWDPTTPAAQPNLYEPTSPSSRKASTTMADDSFPPPSYAATLSASSTFTPASRIFTPESSSYILPSPSFQTTTTKGPKEDDPYSFLSHFDTIFLIDDSGSMAGRSWKETSSALRSIAPICTARDKDGIDIYFLNAPDNSEYKHITTPREVEAIFSSVRPYGGTPTGTRLHQILRPYLRTYEYAPDSTKPLNIIVITDGVPSDDVESVLVNVARKLDRLDAPAWQVGVQFFQVGREPGAAEALKELDDGLAELGGVRDMVDTVPFKDTGGAPGSYRGLDGDEILKVVLGAVNRRLDRKRLKNGVLQ